MRFFLSHCRTLLLALFAQRRQSRVGQSFYRCGRARASGWRAGSPHLSLLPGLAKEIDAGIATLQKRATNIG